MEEELEQQNRVLQLRVGVQGGQRYFLLDTQANMTAFESDIYNEFAYVINDVTELARTELQRDPRKAHTDRADEEQMRTMYGRFLYCIQPVCATFAAAKAEFAQRRGSLRVDYFVQLKDVQMRLLRESIHALCEALRSYLNEFCRQAMQRGFRCKSATDEMISRHMTAFGKLEQHFESFLAGVPLAQPQQLYRYQRQVKRQRATSYYRYGLVYQPMHMTVFSTRMRRPVSRGGKEPERTDCIAVIRRAYRAEAAEEAKSLKVELLWPSERVYRFSDCGDYQRDVFTRSLVQSFNVEQALDQSVRELEDAMAVSPTQYELQRLYAQREKLAARHAYAEERRRKLLAASGSLEHTNWQKGLNSQARREELKQLDILHRKILATQIGAQFE